MSQEVKIEKNVHPFLSLFKDYLLENEKLTLEEENLLRDPHSTFYDVIYHFLSNLSNREAVLAAFKKMELNHDPKSFKEWLISELDDTKHMGRDGRVKFNVKSRFRALCEGRFSPSRKFLIVLEDAHPGIFNKIFTVNFVFSYSSLKSSPLYKFLIEDGLLTKLFLTTKFIEKLPLENLSPLVCAWVGYGRDTFKSFIELSLRCLPRSYSYSPPSVRFLFGREIQNKNKNNLLSPSWAFYKKIWKTLTTLQAISTGVFAGIYNCTPLNFLCSTQSNSEDKIDLIIYLLKNMSASHIIDEAINEAILTAPILVDSTEQLITEAFNYTLFQFFLLSPKRLKALNFYFDVDRNRFSAIKIEDLLAVEPKSRTTYLICLCSSEEGLTLLSKYLNWLPEHSDERNELSECLKNLSEESEDSIEIPQNNCQCVCVIS